MFLNELLLDSLPLSIFRFDRIQSKLNLKFALSNEAKLEQYFKHDHNCFTFN